MTKKLLLFTLSFLALQSLSGQGSMRLLFAENHSQIPIQEVLVTDSTQSFVGISNENGWVELNNLATIPMPLHISCIGYESQSLTLHAEDLKKGQISIVLQPKIASLSEITVTANSHSNLFKTISELDIHLRPVVNSQEVLRIVPGLFIGQHAGGGKAEQLFLRGFDLDHGTDINISVDGMPVNMVSHAHGQGYADLHFVIPELIDKVNFNKGPYYADKGNLTTAGFVEFKTKNYLDHNFVKLEGGQFSTFRGIAGVNLLPSSSRSNNQSLYVAGEASFTQGYFQSPQNFSRYNGLLKYHTNISPNSSLSASLSAFSSEWLASGQIPDRAVADGTIGFYGAIDDKEGGKTSRYNANIEFNTQLNNGAVMTQQVFYNRYLFELYSNFTFYKEDSINGDQIKQKEARHIIGYNGSYKHNYTLWGLKTQSTAGIQMRSDFIDDIELSRTKDRNIVTKAIMLGDIQELNVAAYATQQFTFNSRLQATLGLRADYFNNNYQDQLLNTQSNSHSQILSPKLNFNYRLNEQVQLYCYNGRGFHSNDTRVAVQQAGKKVLPPAWGSDIGGIFKLGDNVMLQSAIWYLWLDQEFVYVGDEGVVEAGGQSQRFGLDVSLRYQLCKNLYGDFDFNIARPKSLGVADNESYIPLAPTITSIGGLTYRQATGFNGSLRYRYMGNRAANEDNTIIAKGYFILDAAINYTRKHWELGLSIQNLLNTKWKETQFDTESRLINEANPVSEIHFTAGTPFFARLNASVFF